MVGFFDTFRLYGGPTLYPSNKTPVTDDVTEWGFAFAIIILIVTFLIILPGFRGKERWYFLIRAVVGCFVLVSIMVCNFGQEWEKASVHNIRTYYKAGTSGEIENVTVTVKIGLRSVNITLKTDPVMYHLNNKTVEEIDYNERFHWNDLGWTQGRGGFGPFATLVNREYRAAQLKGLPYPILWIAEYFTIDGEGIRWGRYYRQAGYFTHSLLWLALPLWIITVMLFKIVLEFGAYFSMATGASLLLANVIYATVRNPLDLEIHVGDDVLSFAWGWTFWLNLVNGLLALFIGIVVWFMNLRFTEAIFSFFGVDILTDIEEYYASIEELRNMGIHITNPASPNAKGHKNTGFDTEPGDVVINAQEADVELYDNVQGITRGFRRKNQGTFAKRFDRSVKVKSRKTESRVDLVSSPYFFGAVRDSYPNSLVRHPHEQYVLQSEYSYRDGILPSHIHNNGVLLPPPTRPPAKRVLFGKKVLPSNPRFPSHKRGGYHKNGKGGGWRPGSDPGHLPFHGQGGVPISYHGRRYSGDGSLSSSVNGYDSWGVTSSDSKIFPQGGRWRPPGGQSNLNTPTPHGHFSSRESYDRHIGNPNYPYRTQLSNESVQSSLDMDNDKRQLYAKRNGLKQALRGKRR